MAAGSSPLHCVRSLFIFSSHKLRGFCTQGDSHIVHVPVMLKECLSFLAPQDGQVWFSNLQLNFRLFFCIRSVGFGEQINVLCSITFCNSLTKARVIIVEQMH